jgi:hypothetical protein
LARARDQGRFLAALRRIVNGGFDSDTYAVLQIFLNWLNVSARHRGGLSATTLLAKGLTKVILPLLR